MGERATDFLEVTHLFSSEDIPHETKDIYICHCKTATTTVA